MSSILHFFFIGVADDLISKPKHFVLQPLFIFSKYEADCSKVESFSPAPYFERARKRNNSRCFKTPKFAELYLRILLLKVAFFPQKCQGRKRLLKIPGGINNSMRYRLISIIHVDDSSLLTLNAFV